MEITEKAINKIKEFTDNEGLSLAIRVKTIGSGCAGLKFDVEYSNQELQNDIVFMIEDIKVIIDEMSYMYMKDLKIDYTNSLIGNGFKFLGSNVQTSCGCVSSISF